MFLAADGEPKKKQSLNGCGHSASKKSACFCHFAHVSAGWRLTFVCVGEGASERTPHSDVTILEVFQYKMLHWDGLSVNLEAVAFIPGDVAGQDQQLSEQEHVQLLRGGKRRTTNE